MTGFARRPTGFCPTRSHERCAASPAGALSPFFDRLAVWFRIIGSVSLNLLRPASRRSAFASDPRNLVEQREQLGDVMTIGLREDHRQRNSVGLTQQMVLAPEFASIRWIWAGFRASARSADRRAIDQCAIPVDLVGSLQLGQERLEQSLPDSGPVPSPETATARMPGREVARGRKPSPRHTGSKNEENAVDDSSILSRLSTGILDMAILPPSLGDERFESLPEFVGHEDRWHGRTSGISQSIQLQTCRKTPEYG